MLFYAVMGKAEGSVAREEWHGHVTALSVAPEFRRLGLAAKLMEMLEEISERLAEYTFFTGIKYQYMKCSNYLVFHVFHTV